MPHSLRVKIKNLQRKGIITDKDCDRLITALDNKDVLDKIKNEINGYKSRKILGLYLEKGKEIALDYVLAIIDKYKSERRGEE